MPSQYLHSGEPLPLAPSLTEDVEQNVIELLNFHTKLLDYLRRLTAKLSSDLFSPPSVGSLATAAFSLDGSFSVSGGPKIIEWDQTIRLDSIYEYSDGYVTFLEAGFYLLLFDTYIGVTNYTTQYIDGDDTIIPYGSFNHQSTIGTMSISGAVPVFMHKDQTLAVQVTGAGGSAEELYSRWTVLRISDFPTSGVNNPCDDFDIWQLCG